MNTPELLACYVNAQVACATIEAMAMKAENEMRAHRGEAPAYVESHFSALIDRYKITHNDVIGMIRNLP